MKSKRRKEDVLNEFRRSELITSARRVFGAHGFANATMEAIAREADVAKGTVYLYYDSKRAIYEAAWRASMEELEALVKARVESAASLQEAIAAFVAARVEFFQARQDFFRDTPRLKWVPSLGTGTDGITDSPHLGKDVVVTATRGIHGVPMSEMAFLMMLAFNRDFLLL